MADLAHSASRLVDQRPDVVHDRLLELAARLQREVPPVEHGTQAASLLGMSGPLGIEIGDRGPHRIELRTTNGRVRGEGAADLTSTPDGRTNLKMSLLVKPHGFGASAMLGLALAARPEIRQQVIVGLERGLDDLVAELAKPDSEWDAGRWQPPGLPVRP
jgi:hypothetical protein